MASNTDYLERLRTIREKYGCSQPKNNITSDHLYTQVQRKAPFERQNYIERQSSIDRGSFGISGHYRPDLKSIDKYQGIDLNYAPSSNNPDLWAKAPPQYSDRERPQSSIGLSNYSYSNLRDYSKRAEKERQIEIIRENYAASRRKVIEDYSAKNHSRDYSKEFYGKQAAKDYLKDYKKDEIRQNQISIPSTKIELLSRQESYISPMKILSEFDEQKIYKKRQTQASQSFWREREAKLSELTTNRLNENGRSSFFRDEKPLDPKVHSKIASVYSDKFKGVPEQFTYSKLDSENRGGDYSVSNIDRIQQRIQSILNKK